MAPSVTVLSRLCPAEELMCACDLQECENATCLGKICFVSKHLENGKATQGKGCLSSHILERCQSAAMEEYTMSCCSSSMCNENISVLLKGTAQP